MTRQDQNVEIARYQKEIAVRLGLDSDNLIFDCEQKWNYSFGFSHRKC